MYTNLQYLLIFITGVFLIYTITPKKYKFIVLILSSYVFYFLVSKFLIIYVLITTITVYIVGERLTRYERQFKLESTGLNRDERKALKVVFSKKKKLFLLLGIVLNVGILMVLKYINFFGETINWAFNVFKIDYSLPIVEIGLPLGISYYTLQALGYIIDVYRGKYEGGNLFKVALFLGYFPALLEGPIGNFDKLADQLYQGNDFNFKSVISGSQLIIWGLIKKIVIADRLNIIVSSIFDNYSEYSGIIIAFAIILFTFQLYAEFSGIIDIVTGVSEVFGIKLAQNFDSPLCSKDISEFWRRWHISLGAWFKDYIFYPITTSKWFNKLNKAVKQWGKPMLTIFITTAVALLPVWLLTGLWHGASWKYVVYGLYYYVLMLIGMFAKQMESKVLKLETKATPKWFDVYKILRTFVLVNIGMLIFKCNDLAAAWDMFTHIFSGGSISLIANGVIDKWDFIMTILGIICLLAVEIIHYKGISIRETVAKTHFTIQWFFWIAAIFFIIIFGAYGNGYVEPDPIYGGF